MSKPFVACVGSTLSADIAVPEHDREKRFYARVLGTGKEPLWRDDLMNNKGLPIIGLGASSPEYAKLPLQWMPHFQVADVGLSVELAIKLGGSELMHGKDEDGSSLWAGLLDPNGAAFGLIPVVSEQELGAYQDSVTNENEAAIGHIAWLDLTVANASSMRDFYEQVVGWSAQKVEMGSEDEGYYDYNMLSADGHPAAGICHARGVNSELPPVWLLYLPVGDLNESVDRVQQEGGSILYASKGSEGNYTYAVIRDPVGVCLALAQT